MSQIGTIAAQGLAFQATVLAQAASNIVNARGSVPATGDGTLLGALYAPKAVVGVTVAGGGVQARLAPVTPASRLVFDSASATGFSAVPDVDLAGQMVAMMMASSSYKAAAKLVAIDAELSRSLIKAIA